MPYLGSAKPIACDATGGSGAEFKVGLGSLGLLISLYIVGNGLTHIPGGVLATKIGMKRTLVLGLLVQGVAGVMSGLSQSYVELAIFRIASGVGGSVFVAMPDPGALPGGSLTHAHAAHRTVFAAC